MTIKKSVQHIDTVFCLAPQYILYTPYWPHPYPIIVIYTVV